MSESDQTTHFADELDKLVERFRVEYDISYAAVVGTLYMKAWLMAQEADERSDEVC